MEVPTIHPGEPGLFCPRGHQLVLLERSDDGNTWHCLDCKEMVYAHTWVVAHIAVVTQEK